AVVLDRRVALRVVLQPAFLRHVGWIEHVAPMPVLPARCSDEKAHARYVPGASDRTRLGRATAARRAVTNEGLQARDPRGPRAARRTSQRPDRWTASPLCWGRAAQPDIRDPGFRSGPLAPSVRQH